MILILLFFVIVIIVVHVSFYFVARQQAVTYIEKKYNNLDMNVGWPKQSIFNSIMDGWYFAPVYTNNNGQEVKFYVDLNMFNGHRDDNFLHSALRVDAEKQFTNLVQEINPAAKVGVHDRNYTDDVEYFKKFGKKNIQYVHNDQDIGSFNDVHISWDGRSKLSNEEFAEKCAEIGFYFLSAYPVYELQFSYTYLENERVDTSIERDFDNELAQLSKEHLYQELLKNIDVYKH